MSYLSLRLTLTSRNSYRCKSQTTPLSKKLYFVRDQGLNSNSRKKTRKATRIKLPTRYIEITQDILQRLKSLASLFVRWFAPMFSS
ncbi:rCG43582 [Rattus norvegicus]|uniref:RCG43582 n=1 Tax=Rattus norvegicus TaxID=10116 RepID=A6JIH0_RAT|nr:rCG43582 [Rattus norvegicus]